MLQDLLWGAAEELTASGAPGGLLHYFDETAQHIFPGGAGGTNMATRTLTTPEGRYSALSDPLTIESDAVYSALRMDHPAFGAAWACWYNGAELIVAVYNYAADVSDIITAEPAEQVDNAIKTLRITAKNTGPDLFAHDMSLFGPGAAFHLLFSMGDSPMAEMGKWFLDLSPYDPTQKTLSIYGRSRIGRLLDDNTIDQRGADLSKATFTGTLPQICTDFIVEISGGELTAADLLIQPDTKQYTAIFDPAAKALPALTDWLRSLGEPNDGGHATLSQGASGNEVRLAQRLLNNVMPPKETRLVVDGSFGPKTEQAVKNFQSRRGLTINGDVDSPTWAALLGGPAEAWDIAELWDGRIVIGNAAWIAQYRTTNRYTFTHGKDVTQQSIKRNLDAAFARVGVKYKVTISEKDYDRYAYAAVDTWPGWAVPSHRTHYMDAPDGSSATQAQEIANKTALELQFCGVVETLLGPMRPELIVGDIAQRSYDGGVTAVVTGIITEVQHKMGGDGFYTSFTADSGGTIMNIVIDHEGVQTEVEVSAPSKNHPTGGNRRPRAKDATKAVIKAVGGNGPSTISYMTP